LNAAWDQWLEFKPWLQVVADSSYSVVTISGTKMFLYGNHFGPATSIAGEIAGRHAFVEALVGGSRADQRPSQYGG